MWPGWRRGGFGGEAAQVRFPENRENNRENLKVHAVPGSTVAERRVNPCIWPKFPGSPEQGKFSPEQGR
jgi:hypothetical protein